jgi:site-specific recombinase XerD
MKVYLSLAEDLIKMRPYCNYFHLLHDCLIYIVTYIKKNNLNKNNVYFYVDLKSKICWNDEFIKILSDFVNITNILPKELNNDLIKSLEKTPRKYLFVNQTGQPFTRNSFTVWSKRILSRLFETEMTLNIIRHLFINTLDMNMKPSLLREISDKMGHDLTTQRLYKWDVSQLDRDDNK